MATDDIPKTAIVTPFGVSEFLRLPFGLQNAAQSFQWLMDSVVYIDDILVASRNATQHKLHLHQLFQRLQEHSLVLNMAKCQFVQTTIDFRGHHIMQHGAMHLPSKVEAITKFKQPVTLKGLQEFVGMVNFYRRFILAAAQVMAPLFAALTNETNTVAWTEGMTKAFQDTKTSLAGAILLTHPRPNAPTSLTVDASKQEVGALLQQLVHGVWQPLAFFSEQLRAPEKKYSAFDHELLALYRGL